MKLLGKIYKYKPMVSYCLKCKKIKKTETQEFQKLVMVEPCYYENVLYIVVKKKY